MRRNRFTIVASGLAVTGVFISMSGCGTDGSGDTNCQGDGCHASNSSTTMSTGQSGGQSGGQGGSGGAPPEPPPKPSCEGNPDDIDPATKAIRAFNEDCSVFASVKAMGATPDGKMKSPYPTLQQAIDNAPTKDDPPKIRWVIACSQDPFIENITTSNNVQIYGGFTCLDVWKRDATVKAQLKAPKADTITLTLQNSKSSGVDAKLQDFVVTALDASTAGGSSIAIAVEETVSLELLNVDVIAGNGKAGENGSFPQEPVVGGSQPTSVGTPACYFTVQGGIGASTTCSDGKSTGGDGGNGGNVSVSGGDGLPGKDGDGATATNGKGGKGATDATTACTAGLPGAKGGAGSSGKGGTEFGSLTSKGITGGDGNPGGDGLRGHGGGGGGGAFHGAFCSGAEGFGASGGGGGSGGCGGKGGGPGKGGGSSIAILSLSPNLKFNDVALTTGSGGKGGNGVIGSAGGAGGLPGLGGTKSTGAGSKVGCDGGKGGGGGDGGPSGSGRGGHSIGVLYKTTPTAVPTIKTLPEGALGQGGDISVGAPETSRGITGTKAACWDAAKNASCPPPPPPPP